MAGWEEQRKRTTSRNLYQFLNHSDRSNVDLVVQGEHLRCHRVVLAACSDYFRELLEKKRSPPLPLPHGVTPATARTLIAFMYEQFGKPNEESKQLQSVEFLKAASLLQMPVLWKQCEDFLVENMAACSEKDAEELVHLTFHYDSSRLKQAYANLKASSIDCSDVTAFANLGIDQLVDLLGSNHLSAPSEDHVIRAFAQWIRNFRLLPFDRMQHLYKHIRFPLADLRSSEVEFLETFSRDFHWVIDEARRFQECPELRQRFASERVIARRGFGEVSLIVVVGSPICLQAEGPAYSPSGWQLFAFDFHTNTWHLPLFTDERSGEVFGYQRGLGVYPASCSYGNQLYIMAHPSHHLICVDASTSTVKVSPNPPQTHGTKKTQRSNQKPDDPQYILSASRDEIRVSQKNSTAEEQRFSVSEFEWSRTEEPPETIKDPVETSDAEIQTPTTQLSLEEVVDIYAKLHQVDTSLVQAVYVEDSVYVVDGQGRVSAVKEEDVKLVAKIDAFKRREKFGLTQVAGHLYVMGGVTRTDDDVIERHTDVFRVDLRKQPPLVERISDVMPCSLVHSACHLLVSKDAIDSTPITGL